MDTGRLKRFATEARTILMQGVKHRLQAMGFDLTTGQPVEMPQAMEGGAVFMGDIVSMDFYKKWMSLYNNIQARSIKDIAEEAAYTWFNRFMAIRIMAKQEFIAPVLAYESDNACGEPCRTIRVPVIVSEARQGRMPQMTEDIRAKLMDLLDDDSKTSEQFALLIVAYCHENPIIHNCFGNITDYTELLLPQNILSDGGFVDMINHTSFITDEQYASVELIGWLYQFYISDRKDEAFAKKGKYDPDEIAPATQIFTPNWIVKYMAENTLGRIYIDNNPYCDLKDNLKYLVRNENENFSNSQILDNKNILKIDDIHDLTCADLGCGSGHILNECFDILYNIYVEEGYSRTQAIKDILRKNIIGIDLDTRAKQLATFALLMKACQKDRSFLDGKVMPRVYDMPRPIAENIPEESKGQDVKLFLEDLIPHYVLGSNREMTKEIIDCILLMNHADTLGSIMKFDLSERTRNAIMVHTQEYEEMLANGEFVGELIELLIPYMNVILALTKKYAAICMNPPYMGSGRFDNVLSKYVKDNYPHSKADLMSVFMDVAIDRLVPNGKYGMINMHSWMFLSSFEELRRNLLDNQTIDSLLHLGPRTFDELSGEVVQNASFVISNCKTEDAKGTYFRLVDGRNCADKEHIYIDASLKDNSQILYKDIIQDKFKTIPGSPIGYWTSSVDYDIINNSDLISDHADTRQGFATGDNNKFLRNIWEISRSSNRPSYKWIPCSKGGIYRKWYGNIDICVNWKNNGEEMKAYSGSVIRNESYYFKKVGATWSTIANKPSFRLFSKDWLFESKGSVCFPHNDEDNLILMGYLNSPLVCHFLTLYSPTLDFHEGPVGRVPFKSISTNNKEIEDFVDANIDISKQDWDSHETSWDFQRNPLCEIAATARHTTYKLEALMNIFEAEQEENFRQLHHNEEELNRQFIEIYGLRDELTPDVAPEDITILQQGEISFKENDNENSSLVIHNRKLVWHYDVLMKQLISYAVGCMMGRYSIDKPGLILANQGDSLKEFQALVPDSRFEVDDDGIIPLMTSDNDFANNATVRFKQWLSVTFGSETLVDNLNYIEAALGKSIDAYFVKDFWKDHKKMYQNRPIYWLFSSKKGAFQCIAYMHRMDAYTAERIRTKYLLPHIEWLVQKQSDMQANAANLTTAERRQLDSIGRQIIECREYHDRLHVIADKQIPFDLDDGVVVNYAKFGDVLQKIK